MNEEHIDRTGLLGCTTASGCLFGLLGAVLGLLLGGIIAYQLHSDTVWLEHQARYRDAAPVPRPPDSLVVLFCSIELFVKYILPYSAIGCGIGAAVAIALGATLGASFGTRRQKESRRPRHEMTNPEHGPLIPVRTRATVGSGIGAVIGLLVGAFLGCLIMSFFHVEERTDMNYLLSTLGVLIGAPVGAFVGSIEGAWLATRRRKRLERDAIPGSSPFAEVDKPKDSGQE